jgi:hypothetical protein
LGVSGESQQTGIETVDPAPVEVRGNGQGQETEAGFSAHRGDVAQAAGKRFPANVFRAVGGAPKVHVFEQKIGGEKEVFAAAAGTEDRAVIADSHDQLRALRELCPAAEPIDQYYFAVRLFAVLDHTNAI